MIKRVTGVTFNVTATAILDTAWQGGSGFFLGDPNQRQGSSQDLDATNPGFCLSLRFPISKEDLMSIVPDSENIESAVRRALLTTRATAACPFHPEVTIRIGDAAADTHAFNQARNAVRGDGGASWDHDSLVEEFGRQLASAADGVCPRC